MIVGMSDPSGCGDTGGEFPLSARSRAILTDLASRLGALHQLRPRLVDRALLVLLGIIDSGKIWASSAYHLNDSGEFR